MIPLLDNNRIHNLLLDKSDLMREMALVVKNLKEIGTPLTIHEKRLVVFVLMDELENVVDEMKARLFATGRVPENVELDLAMVMEAFKRFS